MQPQITPELRKQLAMIGLYPERYASNPPPAVWFGIVKEATANFTRGDPTCSEFDREWALHYVKFPTISNDVENHVLYLRDVWYNGEKALYYDPPKRVKYLRQQFERT